MGPLVDKKEGAKCFRSAVAWDSWDCTPNVLLSDDGLGLTIVRPRGAAGALDAACRADRGVVRGSYNFEIHVLAASEGKEKAVLRIGWAFKSADLKRLLEDPGMVVFVNTGSVLLGGRSAPETSTKFALPGERVGCQLDVGAGAVSLLVGGSVRSNTPLPAAMLDRLRKNGEPLFPVLSFSGDELCVNTRFQSLIGSGACVGPLLLGDAPSTDLSSLLSPTKEKLRGDAEVEVVLPVLLPYVPDAQVKPAIEHATQKRGREYLHVADLLEVWAGRPGDANGVHAPSDDLLSLLTTVALQCRHVLLPPLLPAAPGKHWSPQDLLKPFVGYRKVVVFIISEYRPPLLRGFWGDCDLCAAVTGDEQAMAKQFMPLDAWRAIVHDVHCIQVCFGSSASESRPVDVATALENWVQVFEDESEELQRRWEIGCERLRKDTERFDSEVQRLAEQEDCDVLLRTEKSLTVVALQFRILRLVHLRLETCGWTEGKAHLPVAELPHLFDRGFPDGKGHGVLDLSEHNGHLPAKLAPDVLAPVILERRGYLEARFPLKKLMEEELLEGGVLHYETAARSLLRELKVHGPYRDVVPRGKKRSEEEMREGMTVGAPPAVLSEAAPPAPAANPWPPPPGSSAAPSGRVHATVLSFDLQSGWGSLRSESLGHDVYLHGSELCAGVDPRSLYPGVALEFTLMQHNGQPHAQRVTYPIPPAMQPAALPAADWGHTASAPQPAAGEWGQTGPQVAHYGHAQPPAGHPGYNMSTQPHPVHDWRAPAGPPAHVVASQTSPGHPGYPPSHPGFHGYG